VLNFLEKPLPRTSLTSFVAPQTGLQPKRLLVNLVGQQAVEMMDDKIGHGRKA
jgi:hypothetical protein